MSFQQGLSGLNATSKQLEVIGNNIANASTFGAKSSRAEFSDAYAASLGGAGTNQIGIGTGLSAVSQQFTQGNITATQNPMDLAINGNGFFQLLSPDGSSTFSRNGQFKVDSEGYIVTTSQRKLTGFVTGGADPVPLRLPSGTGIQATATDAIRIVGTLNSEFEITRPAATPFISTSNSDTYNRATSQTVFDSQGAEVTVTYYFQKTAKNEWDVFATANGDFINSPDQNDPQPITSLVFDPATGALMPPIPAAPFTIAAQVDLVTGTGTEQIDITPDYSGMQELGGLWGISELSQNGSRAGNLNSVVIESDGTVLASYDNGKQSSLGTVALTTFRNPQGLRPIGDNQWVASVGSGDGLPERPGEGGRGLLQAGALEESNIDLTGELVSMITAQRAYQANAQSIKTMDQVMQTLVNLR